MGKKANKYIARARRPLKPLTSKERKLWGELTEQFNRPQYESRGRGPARNGTTRKRGSRRDNRGHN